MTLREAAPELNDNQWKIVARLISENIIGEDNTELKPAERWATGLTNIVFAAKNELRAQQRAKLTKELESEG